MKKIDLFVQTILNYFRMVLSRYPITVTLIALVSVFTCVFIDQSGSLGSFMEEKGIPFTILWGIGTFFAETYWNEKKSLKTIAAVAFGLTAAGFIYLTGHSDNLTRETAAHRLWAYGIVLITLGVYRNYKNSGLPFNEFCIRVIHELSRLAIVCAIAALGIVLVMSVFVTLLLNGEHFMLILRAEFLVLGFLVGSGLLNAQISLDRDLSRFFVVIVKYLLTVLVIAAFVIIYAYILKIVITRVVPSNEIFRILAGLFILGLPIWTMTGTFEPDHPLVKIGTKLPYIFIPFLLLQGYAIRERISAYGMTPLRYICLVLMVLEGLYILIYALRKGETGVMLPISAFLAVFCLAAPFVNMFSVSNRSQKAIFDRYITSDFASLPVEDQSSLAGAYYYLTGNAAGNAMLADIDPLKIEAIKASGKIGIAEIDQTLYVYYEFPLVNADISSFGRMSLVVTYSPVSDKEKPERYDPENIEFFDDAGNSVLTADLSGFINACISAWASNPGGVPDFPAEITLPDGSALRVYRCSFTLEPEHVISFLDLNAVLLTMN